MTIVELTDLDAQRFAVYQKYHEIFNAIIEANLHELKRGQAILNFNHDGALMDIEVKRIAYRKKNVL